MSPKLKHKKHKHPPREGENDPQVSPRWSPKYSSWYWERLDKHGHVKYEWLNENDISRLGLGRVPRSEAEELAEDVQNLNIDNTYGHEDDGGRGGDSDDGGGGQGSFYAFQSPRIPEEHIAEPPSLPQYTHPSIQDSPLPNYPEAIYDNTSASSFTGASKASQAPIETTHCHRSNEDYHEPYPNGPPDPYGGSSFGSESVNSVHGHGRKRGKGIAQDVKQYREEHPETHDKHSSSRHDRSAKGKGKEEPVDWSTAAPEGPFAESSYLTNPQPEHYTSHSYFEESGAKDWDGVAATGYGSDLTAHTHGAGLFERNQDVQEEPYDTELLRAMQESKEDAYRGSGGESSTWQSNTYDRPMDPWTEALDATDSYGSTPTLKAMTRKNHSLSTSGAVDEPDPRNYFKVEPSWRFQPGWVFKINWSEPRGSSGTRTDEVMSDPITVDQGEFYTGIRRFIIIATDHGHSTCVPILTYENRGCTKRGVQASKHGIVYSLGQKSPALLHKEPALGYAPVAMRMTVEEKLARESRVNYSKLMTIEHNAKVYFIGAIEGSHFDIVQYAVNKCWESKNHHTKQHKSGKKPKKP